MKAKEEEKQKKANEKKVGKRKQAPKKLTNSNKENIENIDVGENILGIADAIAAIKGEGDLMKPNTKEICTTSISRHNAFYSSAQTAAITLFFLIVPLPIISPIAAFAFKHPIFMFLFCSIVFIVGYAVITTLRKQARDPVYAMQKAVAQELFHRQQIKHKLPRNKTKHTWNGRFMQC